MSFKHFEVMTQNDRILGNTFSRYANYLYSSGLLDAKQRDECLVLEEITQNLIEVGDL